METYSLYTYNCGSLKIFGQRSSRAKHNSVDDAVAEYHSYANKLKRIYNADKVLVNKQILVVRYTDSWESTIVGIIKNGEYKEI